MSVKPALVAILAGAAFALAAPACGDFDGYALAPAGALSADAGISVGPTEPVPAPVPPDGAGRCADDRKLCGGSCVSKSDPAYGCGAACEPCLLPRATAKCMDAACVVDSCAPDHGDCTNAPGCETVTASDLSNCGRCGTQCGPGQVCSNGVCSSTCGQGLKFCGGTCVDLGTSDANCGSCGKACTGVSTCMSGACKCQPSCAGKACGASDGCGGTCGGFCPVGSACVNKQCVADAPACGPDGSFCESDRDCCSQSCTLLNKCLCAQLGKLCTKQAQCCPGLRCDLATLECK